MASMAFSQYERICRGFLAFPAHLVDHPETSHPHFSRTTAAENTATIGMAQVIKKERVLMLLAYFSSSMVLWLSRHSSWRTHHCSTRATRGPTNSTSKMAETCETSPSELVTALEQANADIRVDIRRSSICCVNFGRPASSRGTASGAPPLAL